MNDFKGNLKKIWIALPNQGWMRPELNNLLLNMILDRRYQLKITYPSIGVVTSNQNMAVKRFLESGFDFLLLLEADVVPSRNPLDLVELDKDVIACPCLQWNEGEIYWIVMEEVSEGYRAIPKERQKGLQEVDAVGTGCTLIARRVLLNLEFPFKSTWSKNGIQEMSQDFYFCKRVKKLGFHIFVHWDYPCEHYKTLGLKKILEFIP